MAYKKYMKHHPFDFMPGLQDAKWILDVGANKGDVSEAALKKYPSSKVICFEPVSSTYLKLEQKLLKKYPERVFLYKSGLADIAGTTEINLTNFHGANSIKSQSGFHKALNPHIREVEKETISLVRLDDIFKDFPTDHIDIMKIDVEGFEKNVIDGGMAVISERVDNIIIEASFMRDPNWESQSFYVISSILYEIGFRLINIYDVHRTNELKDMGIVQMDCIWRHKRLLLA